MSDLTVICVGLVGVVLCMIQFALNDFDVDKMMYEEDEECTRS